MLTKCLLRKIPTWKERPWRGELVHLWKRSHPLMPTLVCIYPYYWPVWPVSSMTWWETLQWSIQWNIMLIFLYWFLGKLRCNINSYDTYAHIKSITYTHTWELSWNSISTKRKFSSLSSRRTDWMIMWW